MGPKGPLAGKGLHHSMVSLWSLKTLQEVPSGRTPKNVMAAVALFIAEGE